MSTNLNFTKNFSECDGGNSKRGLKRYYENKDKISNQRKIKYKKDKEIVIQKQNDR